MNWLLDDTKYPAGKDGSSLAKRPEARLKDWHKAYLHFNGLVAMKIFA